MSFYCFSYKYPIAYQDCRVHGKSDLWLACGCPGPACHGLAMGIGHGVQLLVLVVGLGRGFDHRVQPWHLIMGLGHSI